MPKIKSTPRQINVRVEEVPYVSKATGGIKQPHRFRPGAIAIREIERYQKHTKPFIAPTLFSRAVRGALNCLSDDDFTITFDAIEAIQCAAEEHVTTLMRIGNDLSTQSGLETLLPEHFRKAVVIDQNLRNEKRLQFKEERAKVELEYRQQIPLIEHEIEPWEWMSDAE